MYLHENETDLFRGAYFSRFGQKIRLKQKKFNKNVKNKFSRDFNFTIFLFFEKRENYENK